MPRAYRSALNSAKQKRAFMIIAYTSLIATCANAGVNALDYLITLQREKDNVRAHPEQYLPWTIHPI